MTKAWALLHAMRRCSGENWGSPLIPQLLSFCHCRRWERLGRRGGADHGESMGPTSCQVPSSLEAEERDVKERAAGILAAWELKHRSQCWSPGWQGEGRGRSCDVCITCSTPSFVQKRRRPTLGVQLDDKRKEMLKRHPLSVLLDLKCKGLAPCGLGHLLTPRSAATQGLANQCPLGYGKILVSYFCFPLLFFMEFDFIFPSWIITLKT